MLFIIACLFVATSYASPDFTGLSGSDVVTNSSPAQPTETLGALDYQCAADVGSLTELYEQGQTDASAKEKWQATAKDFANSLDSEDKLSDFTRFCRQMSPIQKDALTPVFDELQSTSRQKFSHGLMELSDIWAIPVLDSHFPGYGDRRYWLHYKRGRELLREVGSVKISDQSHNFTKTQTMTLVVTNADWQGFSRKYPRHTILGQVSVRTEAGVVSGRRVSVRFNNGDKLKLRKVEQTEFVWYRLLAAPITQNPILPVYVKAGQYYIPRTMPNSEFYYLP